MSDHATQLRGLGQQLGHALGRLVEAVPGGPHRPTPLARRLGVNRVTVSNLLNAIARPDPFAVLQRLPGPESLRSIVRGAAELGVPADVTEDTTEAIERFATMIRGQFGTRDALNAAISSKSDSLLTRFELDSRYHVFRGMRQVLGVEADTWLTSMVFAPAPGDDALIDVTTIHGALGMRRLRPDVNVTFTFGPPYHAPDQEPDVSRSPVSLQELYANQPAPLETELVDGLLIHRLVHDALGRESVVDMLAVSHNAGGSRRYAAPGARRRGVAVFADVPVKTLVCDALIHESVFPGAAPELLVYAPGARGPANPNDPRRDADRVEVPERITAIADGPDRFDVPEVPNYAAMVDRVCRTIGVGSERFRVHRLVMPYPVHGFQYVMAFAAPPAPGGAA